MRRLPILTFLVGFSVVTAAVSDAKSDGLTTPLYSQLYWHTYTWNRGDPTVLMTAPSAPSGYNYARFCFMTSIEGEIVPPQYYLGVQNNNQLYVQPNLSQWYLDESKFYVGPSLNQMFYLQNNPDGPVRYTPPSGVTLVPTPNSLSLLYTTGGVSDPLYVGIKPGQIIRLPGGGQPYVGIAPGTTGGFYLGLNQIGQELKFRATVYATPYAGNPGSVYPTADWRLYGSGGTTRVQAVCVSFPTP